ncbi:Flp pilus assembly protein CpaB [Chloroflexia bacterium SDU3-3]|nr:Flp pilus assembly protein CpaB [Chloroflexia bacterium SDU3-3]
MRRGGQLILLVGLLLAVVVVAVIFMFGNGLSGLTGSSQEQVLPPTAIPMQRVVVARVDIPRNTLLTDTESLLTETEIPETEYSSQANKYFTNVSELTGKVTISAVNATQPIMADDVTDAGLSSQIPPAAEGQPRTKAISLMVNNLTGVADEITPGDFVDIIASFNVSRIYLRPGFDEQGLLKIVEEQFNGQSTKTLIQNVQVLRIRHAEAAPEGTTTPTAEAQLDESGQPISPDGTTNTTTEANGPGITPGSWLLIVAMTDQQAEILKYSREQGNGITLVLRGRGDNTVEDTRGATLDLLVSNFGLPLPVPAVPAVTENNALTPTPAGAQQPAAPTPTPTP